jgi:hypothetical protein
VVANNYLHSSRYYHDEPPTLSIYLSTLGPALMATAINTLLINFKTILNCRSGVSLFIIINKVFTISNILILLAIIFNNN